MLNIIKILKDTISPKKCYSCKEEGHFLCQKCLSKIKNFDPICYFCKEKNNYFETHNKCKKYVNYDKLIILAHYKNNIISNLIKDAKFYGKKDILEDFGFYLSSIFLENESIIEKNDYVIINSPMHFLRKLKRGYNQSEILAKYLSKKLEINLYKNIILKSKYTKQQSKLNQLERKKNLENSFKINKKYKNLLIGKNIILVDDVTSTGTTINEISFILKKFGAKRVIGLVIASD